MTPQPHPHPILEDSEEALIEGDDYVRGVGTARSALAHREFRLMWLGSFASNIGTWMQTVVLGAYAFELTGSSAFVGALAFAQLGPLLLLSILGGAMRRGAIQSAARATTVLAATLWPATVVRRRNSTQAPLTPASPPAHST